jgi:alpha-L-rhamnosidase
MFLSAKPVFAEGMQDAMNVQLGFYADVPALPDTLLRLTGATMYQIYVNGAFFRSGPARTARNKFRTDELDLTPLLTKEKNTVVILLQSSNCNSYAVPKAPGFLQAEIVSGDRVLAYTAKDGSFTCVRMDSRVQKTLRFSFQRTFTEAYRLNEVQGRFVACPAKAGYPQVTLAEQPEKSLLPRDVYPVDGEFEAAQSVLAQGTVSHLPTPVYPDKREYHPSFAFNCFTPEEIEVNLAQLAHAFEYHPSATASPDASDLTLSADGYALLDLGHELTGLLSLHVHAEQPTKLVLLFDEILKDGQVDATRLDCCNAISYELQAGEYDLLSMEAYSLRYLTVIAVGTGVTHLQNVGIRRIGFPKIDKKLQSDDPIEQEIYAAAIETFRQNTADIYMDCPSRERAGWLCDSFFTSRTEYALTAKCVVERAFLDNFLQAESFPHLPEGMLPMCYPSDHTDGNFIPNWAMFYVLELEEYYARSGDRELIDRAKEKMLALYRFFTAYENADGLLERLPAWVFVEWSRANDLVQEVNYPSNACYAAMLDVLYRLYDLPELHDKAERIRAHIRANAYCDNGFFCDNAVRDEDGVLRLSGECTEVCQYYMFYFGVATPESYPALWQILTDEFGPDRVKDGLYPDIHPANSFIGNYLRQDLLFRVGRYDQILRETRGYFHYMAKKTGTLWENATDFASCNHGFASHVAVWLLGIRNA